MAGRSFHYSLLCLRHPKVASNLGYPLNESMAAMSSLSFNRCVAGYFQLDAPPIAGPGFRADDG